MRGISTAVLFKVKFSFIARQFIFIFHELIEKFLCPCLFYAGKSVDLIASFDHFQVIFAWTSAAVAYAVEHHRFVAYLTFAVIVLCDFCGDRACG